MTLLCEVRTVVELHITLELLHESYVVDVGALWDAYEDGRRLGGEPKLKCGYGALEEGVTAMSFRLARQHGVEWALCTYSDFDLTISGGDAKAYRAYYEELAREIKESPYAPWVILPSWGVV